MLRGVIVLAAMLLVPAVGCAPQGEPAGAEASATSACPTGSALPITGLCSDGAAALFVAVDPSLETLAPKCVWRTREASIADNRALVFRAQDCSGEGWDETLFTYVSGYLKARLASLQEDQAQFALQIFELGNDESAEEAALDALRLAPFDQRERCEIHPLNGPKLAGRVFELAPNAELASELAQRFPGEPWDACGPNGVAMDAVQFWEGRKRQALFHMLGQDQVAWDPASFTFYRRDAAGSWARED
jgi:hypothetical protein